MSASARTYGGRSAAERQAERRARLLAAGLQLWGEHGWAAVSVRGVCAQAGLTDRYFYESFANREALLLAVYDQVRVEGFDFLMAAMADAGPEPVAQMQAATEALILGLLADPHRARIAVVEPAGSPALEQRRRDTYAALASTIAAMAAGHLDEEEAARLRPQLERTALFCVGGMNELVITWLGGGLAATTEELIDHAVAMMTAAFTLR